MKILIIGGTKFLGRHLVDAALGRGHDVTLFNRGKQHAEDDVRVRSIHGDRNRDLDRLSGPDWDAVIDTCGYLPAAVAASAAALAESAGIYVFVSSISAYADHSSEDFREDAPLAQLSAEQQATVDEIDTSGDIYAFTLGEMYGALKSQCEQAAETAMPGRVLNVRSGLIVGPFDPTDRFTYWVVRTAEGGEVLAPGKPDRFVQMIDVRDLAAWIVEMAERKTAGVFNVTGKPFEMTMERMLESIRDESRSDAAFTWVDGKFLIDESVEEWGEMPLYLSVSDAASRGFLSANIDKALEHSLRFRTFSQTIRDTLEWRQSVGGELRAGISGEREAGLLAKWHGEDV